MLNQLFILFVIRPLATTKRRAEGIRENPTKDAISFVLNLLPSIFCCLSKIYLTTFRERSNKRTTISIMLMLKSVSMMILLWRSDLPLFERMTSATVSAMLSVRKIEMMITGFFICSLQISCHEYA